MFCDLNGLAVLLSGRLLRFMCRTAHSEGDPCYLFDNMLLS